MQLQPYWLNKNDQLQIRMEEYLGKSTAESGAAWKDNKDLIQSCLLVISAVNINLDGIIILAGNTCGHSV